MDLFYNKQNYEGFLKIFDYKLKYLKFLYLFLKYLSLNLQLIITLIQSHFQHFPNFKYLIPFLF